jgi:DNA-directed RNA polymerase subunit RPC12/RpoP
LGSILVHSCGNCGKACIPLWRALVTTTVTRPLTCPFCNARLIRKRRVADLLVGAPLALAVAAVHYWHVTEPSFVWFFFSFATITGISLWLHSVVFETLDIRTVSFLGKGKGRKFARHH